MSDGTHVSPTEDRRVTSNAALIGLVNQVLSGMSDLAQKLTDNNEDLKAEIKSSVGDLKAAAFPEGDPDGHRKHHEADIKAAEEKAEFWKKMRYELMQKGLIVFVPWAIYALWGAFLTGPHK